MFLWFYAYAGAVEFTLSDASRSSVYTLKMPDHPQIVIILSFYTGQFLVLSSSDLLK